jgi:hypothetical protein
MYGSLQPQCIRVGLLAGYPGVWFLIFPTTAVACPHPWISMHMALGCTAAAKTGGRPQSMVACRRSGCCKRERKLISSSSQDAHQKKAAGSRVVCCSQQPLCRRTDLGPYTLGANLGPPRTRLYVRNWIATTVIRLCLVYQLLQATMCMFWPASCP